MYNECTEMNLTPLIIELLLTGISEYIQYTQVIGRQKERLWEVLYSRASIISQRAFASEFKRKLR